MSPKKSILIVGGGITGMSAALALTHHPVNIHLLEKENQLGGHAYEHACMAIDTCQKCGSCLSHESVVRVSGHPNIAIRLGRGIKSVDQKSSGYDVKLKNGEQIHADAVIMATGFTPAQPAGLMAEAYQKYDQIISTYDLNQILKQEQYHSLIQDNPSPQIGFVQCVGSRNRLTGKGYCSQVCCEISRRQIVKLLHLMPGVKIKLFYIDLQTINPSIHESFERLKGQVEMIQGVPFEVFNDQEDGKISVIREDETGKRVREHFDVLVLSVGISALDLKQTLPENLGLTTDKFGFINNGDTLARHGIFSAGCAQGPANIVQSKLQGIQSAEKAVQFLWPEPQSNNLSDDDTISVIDLSHPSERLGSIQGTTGHFAIKTENHSGSDQQRYRALLVKGQQKREALTSKTDPDSKFIYDLATFLTMNKNNAKKIPQSIVFRMDITPPSKVLYRDALTCALALAESGRRIRMVMRHMLVNGLAGQQLYDQARRSGIQFLRIKNASDVSFSVGNQGIQWQIKDTTIKDFVLQFESDCMVIPESITPNESVSAIAGQLGDIPDSFGYLTSPSIWQSPVQSRRKGVYYMPPDLDADEEDLLLDTIFSDIRALGHQEGLSPNDAIQINAARCKKCLTCYRVCPHDAITLDQGIQPLIQAAACYGCGLCMASCPALAIESVEHQDRRILSDVSTESIMVFACERSGFLAAQQIHLPDNANVQKVPCACRVSTNILLKTLESGVGKVILAGCHKDNCQSLKGTDHGHSQIKALTGIPGIDSTVLDFFAVAANEHRRLEIHLNQIATGEK